ncbi:formylglycine-generating enzyme family protein [Pantoea eucrina]|uniref:Formylglycine-generating enzyme family protein n=1 Tax=Pantoea eucrina TaxID=472693 RepID=A0ABU5LHF3_9GAMM|nr:SUMF1/EgtB/PvdO family nonheme iron enzyme [Pantoea eucrina]MDZ7279156.1 formylglycine-generating enzyme family protein [Pantoea eucrina]
MTLAPSSLSFWLAVTLTASAACAQAEPWTENIWNPKPDGEDIILPMPCEGSMAFRRVEIPLAGPLDDLPITLGQDSGDWGVIEHSYPAFIAGSFSDKKAKGRYYLMAKYELTALQYQAITQGTCPTPSRKLSVPVTGVSWFDAVGAADKYNQWLRSHAMNALPQEDGSAGFLRLPTEVEWEFAARGGLKVNSAEFRDQHYPMDDIKNFEWYSGAQSSNGRVQLIGLLQPNPLGLYDMLGNVSEMMFNPFYLNKLNRLHGQAGGVVVRGGNFLSGPTEIRSATRKEVNYYDQTAPSISKTTGIRLVLVAPTLTSTDKVKQLEKSWENLGAASPAAATKADDAKDTVKALGSLASNVDDAALKQQLKNLENQLRASNQKQQEERDQSIRASLNLGSFLCTKLQDDGRFLDFLNHNYALLCKNAETNDANCALRKTKLSEQTDRLQQLTSYYASSLVDAATLYGTDDLKSQTAVFEQMLTLNKRLSGLRPFLNAHWQNQQHYLANGKIDTAGWLESCKQVSTGNAPQADAPAKIAEKK